MLAALPAPAAAQSQGSSFREVSRLSDAARGSLGTGPRPPTRAMVRRREPLPLRPPPTSGKLSLRRWECWESRRARAAPPPPGADAAACGDLRRAANGPGVATTAAPSAAPRASPAAEERESRLSGARWAASRSRLGLVDRLLEAVLLGARAVLAAEEGGPRVCWVVGDAGLDDNQGRT